MREEDIVATVRVRSDVPGSPRPSTARLEAAAAALSSRGFIVVHVGRFGVSVRAAASLFERALGSRPVASQSLVAQVCPPDPGLAQLIDGLEVAPPAEPFAPRR